jgi:hypothetical protein
MMCSTKANQKNSPFLRLPAELRNQIYALACDTMIVHEPPRRGSAMRCMRSGSGLRLICRQVNHEVSEAVEEYTEVHLANDVSFSLFCRLPYSKAALEMSVHRALVDDILQEKLWNAICEFDVVPAMETFPNVRCVKVRFVVELSDQVKSRHALRYAFGREDLEVAFN